MKKEDAYNQDEFVHDVLDFLVEYDKWVMQGMNKLNELQERINNAIKFVETEYNSYPSSEEWRKALLDILKGSDTNEYK